MSGLVLNTDTHTLFFRGVGVGLEYRQSHTFFLEVLVLVLNTDNHTLFF